MRPDEINSIKKKKTYLDGRDAEDEDDGDHGDFLAESRDGRNPVEQHDEQEVEVGEAVELFQQVLGHERQRRVLGGADAVVGVRLVRMVSSSDL